MISVIRGVGHCLTAILSIHVPAYMSVGLFRLVEVHSYRTEAFAGLRS